MVRSFKEAGAGFAKEAPAVLIYVRNGQGKIGLALLGTYGDLLVVCWITSLFQGMVNLQVNAVQ